MANVTWMVCLMLGSPIKQRKTDEVSPFSCSLGSQEHKFVTRPTLTDVFNYVLNEKPIECSCQFP